MTMTFAMPTPPTSSATPPRARNNDVNAPFAAAFASIASVGRSTETSLGAIGFAVFGMTAAAASTRSVPAVR